MADLDDFFAKKDRKKSSKTKKFSTTDEVAKKLEDTSKKPEKLVKKDRPLESEEGGAPVHEQDEWKDFEEEKKDYTGLKIGNLTINPEQERINAAQDENSEQEETTYDDAGNEIEKRATGPWKRVGDGNAVEAPRVEEKKPQAEQQPSAPTANVFSGTYVPPGMRNMSSQPQTIQPGRLRSKIAPDINNEEFFPTLAGSKGDQKRGKNEGSFEVVSHNKSSSIRQTEQAKNSGQGPKLTLENRYNTLSSNDS